MSLFSQMWQTGVQHFTLACFQNLNPCRNCAALSVSVISSTDTTKLGDPTVITDCTHLFNAEQLLHGGHLKIGGSKCFPISQASLCQGGRFPTEALWATAPAAITAASFSVSRQSAVCSGESAGPANHADIHTQVWKDRLLLFILLCSRMVC